MRGWKLRSAAARRWHGASYKFVHPWRWARFVFGSRETGEYTYEVDNEAEMASFVATFLGVPSSHVHGYFDELAQDEELRQALRRAIRGRGDRDPSPRYGRRAIAYALARIARPQVVVEAATHDGLQASVLARALQINAMDRSPGRLWSFDARPGSGWMLPGALRGFVQLVPGELGKGVPAILGSSGGPAVGLFVHTGMAASDEESAAYASVQDRLSEDAIVLSDNVTQSSALHDFALRRGARFARWKERPRRHPAPGVDVGLANWG